MRQNLRFPLLFLLIILGLALPEAVLANKKKPPIFHYRNQVAVLMYHHISNTENHDTISAKRLRSHLKALKDNGYRFISMNDFLLFKLHGHDVPDNAVLITFDDGYESVYTDAYPVLQEFGVDATAFIVVRSSDEPMKNGEALPHLTWDQMREMKAEGHSFYSHTYGLHHFIQADEAGGMKPALTGAVYDPADKVSETPEEYRARVLSDLLLANKRLYEELGNKTGILCFPYGKYNDEVIRIAEEAQIRLLFTTKTGINGSDKDVLIKRINAGSNATTDRDLLKKLKAYDQPNKSR